MKTPENDRQNLDKKGYQRDIIKKQTIMKTPENDRQNLDKRSYKRDREQTTMKVPENINKTLLRWASKQTLFKELGEII